MTRHQRRYGPDPAAELHVATCVPCGNKRSYRSRKGARGAARGLPSAGHMSAFPCPHVPEGGQQVFHFGHLPQSVRNGTTSKTRYLNGTPPIRLLTGVDGMAVQATFADPRDAARVCDALLVAADVALASGRPTLADRYIRLGNSMADAMDRTNLPPINGTAEMARAETLA